MNVELATYIRIRNRSTEVRHANAWARVQYQGLGGSWPAAIQPNVDIESTGNRTRSSSGQERSSGSAG